MLTWSIILTALSALVLGLGIIWSLKVRGRTTHRSGPEIGAELMAEKLDRQAFRAGKRSLFRRTWFWGKGRAVETEATFSYAEIGRALREGRIRSVLPGILGLLGFVGCLLFGGLSLLLGLESKIPGAFLMVAGVYLIYLVASALRASRLESTDRPAP